MTAGLALEAYGVAGVGTVLMNEAKDEVLSQATGGASDVLDASTQVKKLGKKVLKSVDDVLKGATKGDKTKGKSTIFEKDGGADAANKDFDDLGPNNVKEIDGGRTGQLEDGRKVNVRENSKDGRHTLEIQEGKKKTKVRYDEPNKE